MGDAADERLHALNVQETFDSRRKYLEEIDRRGLPPSELVEKIDQQAQAALTELHTIEEHQTQMRAIKAAARKQLEEQTNADAAHLFKTTGATVPMSAADADALTLQDVQLAREDL